MAATSTTPAGCSRAAQLGARSARQAPLALLLALVPLFGTAWAQPPRLEAMLPGTTVVAFHAAPASGDVGSFTDIFAALDTAAAGDTLGRLLRVLGAVAEADADLDLAGMAFAELAGACPAAEALWDEDAASRLWGPAVLAVSVSPFSPLPGALALLRPADPDFAALVQDALVDCFAGGPTLQQDDVTLHILGDGGDLPLVVARSAGTFMAGTDPDLLRAALRLAAGSDEPSHLERPIGRAASPLMGDGMGFTIDFGALAEGLSTITGLLVGAPEEQALVDRLLQTLASLGGVAARVTLDDQGLRFDSVMTPDASAGDAALAAMIGCPDCAVGASHLLPAGAAAVSGRYFDVQALVAWIDDWLGVLGPLVGEPLDLRSLAAQHLGLDLDALLLDWIGSRWHSARLGVLGTDVRGWIVGPGTVTSVPVTSEAAARTAIADWRALLEGDEALGDRFAELFGEFMFMADPFGPGPADLPLGGGGLLAAREVEHRGVGFERWRIGPTTDVGLMVLDGHLLIGTPAAALRAAIDVHLGGPAVTSDGLVGPALAGLPSTATGYAFTDVARQLHGLADAADLLSAPLATAMSLAAAEALADPWGFRDDPWGFDDGGWDPFAPGAPSGLWRSADRFGATLVVDAGAQPLTVPGSLRAEITEADALPNGDLGLVFTLEGLIPGSDVTVEMVDPLRDWDMDTYLYLYDVGAGRIVADDDDSPDTNRSLLVFTVEPGVHYAVVASSYGGSSVGPIELNAEVLGSAEPDVGIPDASFDEPPPQETLVAPTFAELVALFDVVADGLRAAADRAGLATSITVVEDGVRRTTTTLPLR
jgi:hypothetical protein